METQLIVQNNVNGKPYDISELVTDVSWATTISNQPGKLTFSYLNDSIVEFAEGSPVSFSVGGTGVFYGYVFKRTISEEQKVSVIAYDQMRYLKNKETYDGNSIKSLTASQIFTKVCGDFKLKSKVVSASDYVVGPRIYDNKTLFEIIQHGIDETLTNKAVWHVVRDNYGTLEFINVKALKTNLFIGDKSLLTSFNFESSIDDNTYNRIKLIKENKTTKKREVYVIQDSSTIAKWGILQYFENLDESANEAQIKAKAEALLKLKNKVTKKLKLTCFGDLKVFAGAGIILGISSLLKESVANNQYYMVTSCTHLFKNNEHMMQLELQVSL